MVVGVALMIILLLIALPNDTQAQILPEFMNDTTFQK